jgi:MerR family transcriptional regulator, light-induced transcriptional regulator
MNSFTIKDLENLSGIKAHTIRIWEQRYSFLKPQRTDTNIRYYTSEELKTVLNIALLNKYGFKISHIDRMNDDEISSKLITLTDSQAQQEKMINDLIGNMIDMEVDKFEAVIERHIRTKGIEKTITQLIFPYLERIGILWQTNHINPAQEHLVTNVIRQKLIVGIDSTAPVLNSSKTVLLFLPEGEFHEVGLLYMYFLLKSRGVKVYYLGANVPYKDVSFLVKHKTPHQLYTHITFTGSNKIEKYLVNLRETIPANIPIIVSGQITQSSHKANLQGIDFRRSMTEVLNILEQ